MCYCALFILCAAHIKWQRHTNSPFLSRSSTLSCSATHTILQPASVAVLPIEPVTSCGRFSVGFGSKPGEAALSRFPLGFTVDQYPHHVQTMVGYDKDDVLTTNQKLIVGCFSGVITRFVTQPMDVIKLRTQLQKTSPTRTKFFRVTRKILREEGIMAFWHGHNLGQIYSVLGVSSQFFVYEMSTRYVASTDFNKDQKHLLVFFSGILAGCASATLVLPLEVIRVRQMLVKEQYKGIIKGAKGVYSSGGILAFYEGLTASLLQMGPQVGISFWVFRFVQPLLLKYLQNCEGQHDGHACRHAPSNVHRPEYLLLATTLAGSASGFISKTMTYPFDLAKRRMQIGSHKEDERYKPPSTSKNLIKCKALIDCLVKTVKYEGFLGLYRGWKVTTIKAQITSVVAFTSYELFCYVIREFELHK